MSGSSPIIRVRVPQCIIDRIEEDIELGASVSTSEWVMQAIYYKMFLTEIRMDLIHSFDKILKMHLYSREYNSHLNRIVQNAINEKVKSSIPPQE
jgi:Arc/MetJ-type ribon-helix-helix transcriptional regulator